MYKYIIVDLEMTDSYLPQICCCYCG